MIDPARVRVLLAQIEATIATIRAMLDEPASTPALVATSADLTAALAVGGAYRVSAGMYVGNFTVTKPTALTCDAGAILKPADLLQPTLQVLASHVSIDGATVLNGAPDRDTIIVGRFEETDASKQPDDVQLTNLTVTAGAQGGHRAFALHGSHILIKGCRVTGFYEIARDSQAVWIHNGPGPYTIEDNYLEASGEIILTGGDHVHIPNCVPSDIAIRRNTCVKPQAWRANGAQVKNAIEIKLGRTVLIEGNTIDGNWRSGQDGSPILVTVRNSSGRNPWAIADDVTIVGNVTKNCPDGYAVSILGLDDGIDPATGAIRPSQQTQRITITNNLFTDSPNGVRVGNAVASLLTIENNTMPAVTDNFLQFYDTRPVIVKSPLTFRRNVVRGGDYGISGGGYAPGLPALNGYTVPTFDGNVIEQRPVGVDPRPYPPANRLIANGRFLALLDPVTFKMLDGTAGYA